MADQKNPRKNEQKNEQQEKKGVAEERAEQRRQAEREEREEAQPLDESQAPVNPVEANTMQANYDPTGQIIQPGEPLHSTDPEEQAAFERERQEAVRRSQLGATYVEDDEDVKERESTRKNS